MLSILLVLLINVALLSAICDVGYKVYVYELPKALILNADGARQNRTYHVCRKCIYEQFALEYIIHDYFTHAQFCGRTQDPEEADFFYLPIVRDIDYRIALARNGDRTPSPIEMALLGAIEKKDMSSWQTVFNVTDKYWRRHNGADHILVMPAPVTNFRHQTNMRGFFHYMPQLAPPLFLSVELSRSFLQEYPACASKNLVLPYAGTDANYFLGRYTSSRIPRSKLLFYQGGMHGSCIFVRLALNALCKGSEHAVQRGDRKREEGFQMATFCPIPVGDSPSCKRMYDAVNLGCIPVLLSDDAVWAFPASVDPALFSLQLPQAIVFASPAYLLQQTLALPMPSTSEHAQSIRDMVRSILQQLAAEDERLGRAWVFPLDLMTANATTAPKARLSPGAFSNAFARVPLANNTLLRLLQRLPEHMVKLWQSHLPRAASQFQFYSQGQGLPYTAGEALTARRTLPSGGAMRLLDSFLAKRKAQGIADVAQRCAEEVARPGHRYVNHFPCVAT